MDRRRAAAMTSAGISSNGTPQRPTRWTSRTALRLWFCALAGVATLAVAAAHSSQDVDRRDTAAEHVNSTTQERAAGDAIVDQLPGLSRGRIVYLNLPSEIGSGFSVTLPLDDPFDDNEPAAAAHTIQLHRHAVTSPDFQLLVQVEGGALIPHEPGPVRTLRGTVRAGDGMVITDAAVAGSLLENGLVLRIFMDDGRQLWLEPLNDRIPGIGQNAHVLYDSKDVVDDGWSCSTPDAPPFDPLPIAGGEEGGGHCSGGLCHVYIGLDADFDYFLDYGSVDAAAAQMQAVINTMNLQYETQLTITHDVSAIIVRTSKGDDPYTSTDAETLVGQFRTHWETNHQDIPRHLAQLFTGKDLDGTTNGRAFEVGVLCNQPDKTYSICQSDFNGVFSCTTDLHAHENGHIWSAQHCNCPSFTMNPVTTCANEFSPTTVNVIAAFRNLYEDCFYIGGGTVSIPFFDDFNSADIDFTQWVNLNEGATISDEGVDEPSPPTALKIDGSDTIATQPADLRGLSDLSVNYWWQRTGFGNSPEIDEDLVVEFLDENYNWIEIARYPGEGPDDEPFVFESIELPPSAYHQLFRLQFRGTSINVNSDDWFIDDVSIQSGDVNPCPADIAGDDGVVNTADLLALLGWWGFDEAGAELQEPFDVINTADLLFLLKFWGPCN